MENSQEQERTYLFSISSGLQMAMASVETGSVLFTTWFASLRDVSPTSSSAYAGLICCGYSPVCALVPIALLTESRRGMAPVQFLHRSLMPGKNLSCSPS